MIWDPNRLPAAGDSTIVSHITAEVEAVCGDDRLPDFSVEEIAKAVELFLKDQNVVEDAVDARILAALTAKALASVGEEPAARRVYLVGTGLVRASEWVVSGGDSVWTLDLKEMTVRDEDALELSFFASLGVIIESISDVWDPSDGVGILGLRHISKAAAALLGGQNAHKQIRVLTSEIKDQCGRKLEQISHARGWRESPVVMDLDM